MSIHRTADPDAPTAADKNYVVCAINLAKFYLSTVEQLRRRHQWRLATRRIPGLRWATDRCYFVAFIRCERAWRALGDGLDILDAAGLVRDRETFIGAVTRKVDDVWPRRVVLLPSDRGVVIR